MVNTKKIRTTQKSTLIRPGKQKSLLAFFSLFVFIFAVFLYGNTIRNKYALDDHLVTYPNQQIAKGIKAIPEIFTTRYASEGDLTYGYRPLVKTTFAIEYELWGFKPGRSHFINLLLYAITGLLLFSLLRRLLKDHSVYLPFLITLLFVAHPIHTEVVASLKNRDEILGFLFNIATLLSILRYVRTRKAAYLVLGVISFLMVLISKPSAGAFIIIYPLVLYFFTDIKTKPLISLTAVSVVLLVLFLLIPKLLLPENVRPYMFYENPLFYDPTLGQRIGTGFLILLSYLKLMVYPHPLLFYYGYDMIPLVNPASFKVIISILIHLGLFIYSLYLIRKKHILSFAILFYLLAIAPYSNLLVASPGMVAERFAYAASLGFCMALVYLLFLLFNDRKRTDIIRGRWSPLIFIIPFIILVLYSFKTINRNKDWKDPLTLYENDIGHLDRSVKAHMLYASAMTLEVIETFDMQEQAKMIELIPEHYKKAIGIYPENYEAMVNLGSFYSMTLQDYEEAIKYFRQALEIEPNRYEPYYNLAYAHEKSGDTTLALKYYNKALDLAPQNIRLRSDLSRLLFHAGEIQKAINHNFEIIRSDSTIAQPYLNLGDIYMVEDSARGIYFWEKAMSLEPDFKKCMEISWYYRQQLDTARTWYYYNMAQEIRPRMKMESK